MKTIPSFLAIVLVMVGAASAQTIGPMVPFSGGGSSFNCSGATCASAVNGVYVFIGPDGTTQFATGATNTATEYLQAIGGIAGAGGSLIAVGAASSVSINFTSKGNADVNFGNSGSGKLATAKDPGATVSAGNPQVFLTPSVSNGPTKIGNPTYGVNLDCAGTAQCQVAGSPLTSDFPGYIANNWYVGFGQQTFAAGTAPGSNSIRIYPAYIKQRVTINLLGTRITTQSAGGNLQLAIYANNPATGRPTGNALASTASITTGTATSVSSAVNIQLDPGLYWFASNCDNGTAVMVSTSQGSLFQMQVAGTATQSSLGNGVNLNGLSVAQTFGTWPDLTAGLFTDVVGGNSVPIVSFRVASVP